MTAHESAPPSPERERFEALIRESPLNANPDADIRQFRIGKRAAEAVRKSTSPERRAVLAREMAQIHEAEANERQASRDARVAAERVAPKPIERTPMQQLVHDLIAASIERARLGVPSPPALSAVSGLPVSSGEIGVRMEGILRMSLGQSRLACDAAAEAEKRQSAERLASRSADHEPTPEPAGETR